MNTFKGIALAILLSSCVAESEGKDLLGRIDRFDPTMCNGHWHVDRASFEANAPEALPMLDASPAAWARLSGRLDGLTLGSGPGQRCTLRMVATAPDGWPSDQTGLYDPKTGDITVVSSRLFACEDGRTPCLGAILLHEIGHGMGMKHTSHGIMATGSVAPFWTHEDHTECVRVGACDENPNWQPTPRR